MRYIYHLLAAALTVAALVTAAVADIKNVTLVQCLTLDGSGGRGRVHAAGFADLDVINDEGMGHA